MPKDLLLKVDVSAKARCISRADYIRQALVRATKDDTAFVQKEITKYLDPNNVSSTEQRDEDEALLRKYGMID